MQADWSHFAPLVKVIINLPNIRQGGKCQFGINIPAKYEKTKIGTVKRFLLQALSSWIKCCNSKKQGALSRMYRLCWFNLLGIPEKFERGDMLPEAKGGLEVPLGEGRDQLASIGILRFTITTFLVGGGGGIWKARSKNAKYTQHLSSWWLCQIWVSHGVYYDGPCHGWHILPRRLHQSWPNRLPTWRYQMGHRLLHQVPRLCKWILRTGWDEKMVLHQNV